MNPEARFAACDWMITRARYGGIRWVLVQDADGKRHFVRVNCN